MKDSIKVSIAGIVFSLDDEAHIIIKNYLDKLKNGYSNNPDGREIIADIEARIAELILMSQPAEKTVNKNLAESIVNQLGFPDNIELEPEPEIKNRFQRRLYRSYDEQKIGGVCGGLGAYFDISPAWLRIGLFIPLLLGIVFDHGFMSNFFMNVFGCFVLLYLIMWISIPSAKTARERLEMTGEKVTAKSIRDNMTDTANSDSTKRNASVWSEIFYIIGNILLICVKAFIVFLGVIFGVIALCIAISFIMILSGSLFSSAIMALLAPMETMSPIIFLILIFLSLMLFFAIIIYALIKIFSRKTISGTPLIVMIILWLIITITVGMTTIVNLNRFDVDTFLNEINQRRYYNINLYQNDSNEFELSFDESDFYDAKKDLDNIENNEFFDDFDNSNRTLPTDSTNNNNVKSLNINITTET